MVIDQSIKNIKGLLEKRPDDARKFLNSLERNIANAYSAQDQDKVRQINIELKKSIADKLPDSKKDYLLGKYHALIELNNYYLMQNELKATTKELSTREKEIFEFTAENIEVTPSEICDKFDLKKQNVSNCLKRLKEKDLIYSNHIGNHTWYSLSALGKKVYNNYYNNEVIPDLAPFKQVSSDLMSLLDEQYNNLDNSEGTDVWQFGYSQLSNHQLDEGESIDYKQDISMAKLSCRSFLSKANKLYACNKKDRQNISSCMIVRCSQQINPPVESLDVLGETTDYYVLPISVVTNSSKDMLRDLSGIENIFAHNSKEDSNRLFSHNWIRNQEKDSNDIEGNVQRQSEAILLVRAE